MKSVLSMFRAKVAGMCSAWCELGTGELLVWHGALPMAMGQRIPLAPGVKEDSGCRSSWLPVVEAFGWSEAPGHSAVGFCSDALKLCLGWRDLQRLQQGEISMTNHNRAYLFYAKYKHPTNDLWIVYFWKWEWLNSPNQICSPSNRRISWSRIFL